MAQTQTSKLDPQRKVTPEEVLECIQHNRITTRDDLINKLGLDISNFTTNVSLNHATVVLMGQNKIKHFEISGWFRID